jgi:hypothetical protein
MRRILLSVLVLSCSLFVADRADCKGKPGGGGSGGGSATSTFQAVNGSGVTGRVSLSGSSAGTNISVSLNGLQPNVEYVASWSTTVACDMGNLAPIGAFYRFRGSRRGTASVGASVAEPFDQIHSIAIQVDTGTGLALVACAPVN